MVCIATVMGFILATATVMIDHSGFDFNLDAALSATALRTRAIIAGRPWISWLPVPTSAAAYKVLVAVAAAGLAGCLAFPGLRAARCHVDALASLGPRRFAMRCVARSGGAPAVPV